MIWLGNICVTEEDGSRREIISCIDVQGISDKKKILADALQCWFWMNCPLTVAKTKPEKRKVSDGAKVWPGEIVLL